MSRFAYFAGSIAILCGLLLPFSTSALGLSFGGRIIAGTPCVSLLGPSAFVTIAPAGPFQPFYIWTPATLTTLPIPPIPPFFPGSPAIPGIPPTHIGQQVIGIADIPYFCYIPPFQFFYGQRMQVAVFSPV